MRVRTLGLAAWCFAVASPTFAQAPTDHGIFVSIGAAAGPVDGAIRGIISLSISDRLTTMWAIGLEATGVPLPRPAALQAVVEPAFNQEPIETITFDRFKADATLLTGNVRFEIPFDSARILPFVIGGLGVGRQTDYWQQTGSYSVNPSAPAGITFLPSTQTVRVARSYEWAPALTLGVGASILIGRHFSIDVEGRYAGVFDDRGAQTMRLGTGLTYRF